VLDRRIRLSGIRGEGVLVAVSARFARGTLLFPAVHRSELSELADGAEPAVFEGVLVEGALATRIVGTVRIGQPREVFAGVEVEALFGDVPAEEMTVRYTG
jgi:hypothetical protein